MDEIELVVKMPKNTYRQIQALARNGYFEHDICGNSMRRIANGVPLPKGHGRLIDEKILLRKLRSRNFGFNLPTWVKVAIDDTPTIIEADKN